jgi:propanol-preferring alcohol dehydrogenase
MKALRLMAWKSEPELVDVADPTPGPGQVVIRVGGAGACHSDLHLMHDFEPGLLPWGPPFTLGHENAGWVAAVGAGVHGLAEGDAVAVYGAWGCGRCRHCILGMENYCERPDLQGASGGGLGFDGGMAPYMLVPQARWLLPLEELDPVAAAPLTDAGATSYHVVRKVRPKLVPGATAVVIGAGGLGSYAIQHLRLLTTARIVAVDVDPGRLVVARELGADEVLPSDRGTAAAVRDLTDGLGAEVVLDFVGSDVTARTALRCARAMGAVALVGAGGGAVPVGWGRVPLECDVFVPMGATLADLREVVALARNGRLRMDVEVFPFDRAVEAYERFGAGELRTRAVVSVAT